MKKLWLAVFFLVSVPMVNAQLLLNDTFDRTTIHPWSRFIAPCTSNVAINGSAMIQSQDADCLAFATWSSPTKVTDFYFSFDYTHETDNIFIAEWSSSGKILSIRFNTQDNIIEISNVTVMQDFPSLSSGVFVTYPYTFGFASGSTHNINVTLTGNILSIMIDGNTIFEQSNSRFVSAVTIYGLGLLNDASSSAVYDNVVIYSIVPPKTQPKLVLTSTPNAFVPNSATDETEITVTCYEVNGYPVRITMREEGVWERNGTASVSEVRVFDAGFHAIECISYEDANYYSDETFDFLNITTAVPETTTTTTLYNVSWMQPILNETEVQEANLNWIMPFFTPFFFAIVFMLLTSSFITYISKSPIVGASVLLIFLIVYGIVGILPTWVMMLLIILSALLVAMKIREVVGGK